MAHVNVPQRVDGLEGTLVRAPFGSGSKSARDAVWLEAPGQRLVVRRKDGPTFGDTTLEARIGQRVRCAGFIVGHTLLTERIDIVA